ncbi:hypothetical protein [uncultured Oxalicibacterium sp.]|uniref:hypothetical protein n=1 Tax=uncultured Oxalicibacterium sp. TaxID=1168540 RepID=UPI0025D3B423|nr:hypothetical protein [uncultured Oxalicibacterium sp.]
MNPLNVQFNVNVLTVPAFIQPNEFPSWLNHEARALQDLAQDNSLIILRLFLAQRIKDAWAKEELDVLLQGITEKFPHIFRVEMLVIDDDFDLNMDDIEFMQSDAEHDIAQLMESIERYEEQKIARGKLH